MWVTLYFNHHVRRGTPFDKSCMYVGLGVDKSSRRLRTKPLRPGANCGADGWRAALGRREHARDVMRVVRLRSGRHGTVSGKLQARRARRRVTPRTQQRTVNNRTPVLFYRFIISRSGSSLCGWMVGSLHHKIPRSEGRLSLCGVGWGRRPRSFRIIMLLTLYVKASANETRSTLQY